eukprot:5454902-Pleurochrysis_carterae.AAC.1
MAQGDAAMLTLPHVKLSEECNAYSYGAVQLTEQAWGRFTSASSDMLQELRRSTAHAFSLNGRRNGAPSSRYGRPIWRARTASGWRQARIKTNTQPGSCIPAWES